MPSARAAQRRERKKEKEEEGEKEGEGEEMAAAQKRRRVEGNDEGEQSERLRGGSVWVWGEGDFGQLGLGVDRLDARMRPTPVGAEHEQMEHVVGISAGGMHTLTVDNEGKCLSWGVNDERALGRTADEEGGASPGEVMVGGGMGRIVAVSCGDSHSLFLSDQGRVFGCGTFREDGPMGFSPGVRIQEGIAEVLIPELVSGRDKGERIVKIASGADHAVMLSSKGNAFSLGYGGHGQLGRCGSRFGNDTRKIEAFLIPARVKIPMHAGKVVDIVCGSFNTVFLTEKDKVYGCGLNNYGQLAIDGGKGILHKPSLMKAVSGRNMKRICCGQHHSLAIVQEDGKDVLLSFGRAAFGRLGREVDMQDGDAAVPTPGVVSFKDTDVQVSPTNLAAGLAISAAIMSDGTLYTWGCGANYLHAKGDDEDDEFQPRKVKETKRWNTMKVNDIKFGGQHSVMLCTRKN